LPSVRRPRFLRFGEKSGKKTGSGEKHRSPEMANRDRSADMLG